MHHQVIAIAGLLAGALTNVQAAPSSSTSTLSARAAQPQCWSGNAFPASTDWLSFDTLFAKWAPTFRAMGDTDAELSTMREALSAFSAQGGFDAALATAMMVRETHGDTCAVCGDGGVSCGLLQVHGAPGSCAGAAHPCPDDVIRAGIECGTVGCAESYGSSVKGCIAQFGTNWGAVLRCYNSGVVKNPADLRDIAFGDPAYVQQVANILLGADDGTLVQLEGSQCGF
ncbi:hypothetical protein GGR54DRAFT_651376 [Hypoxylon sp. NC1633]|nr:hypothetical protein GGR54DRAFT_651376 [Hypoxylon sp. NC1633]